MPDGNFVVYTQSCGPSSTENRRQVARFIGKNFRNRSAPSTRRSSNLAGGIGLKKLTSARDKDTQHATNSTAPQVLLITTIPRDGSSFRADPFGALPMTHNTDVMGAVDYYVNVYSPTHLIGMDSISLTARIKVSQEYFREVMSWPVAFEAILALAYSNLASLRRTPNVLNSLALNHYSQAISLLRSCINGGCIEDSILLAIVSLIGVNYLWNDLFAFQANLNGLRQIIALRGGLSRLGYNEFLKPAILTIESFWILIRSQTHLLPEPFVPAVLLDSDMDQEEKHDILALQLPLGFQSLAQHARLSLPVIRAVLREVEFSSSAVHSHPTSFVHYDGVRKFAHLKTRTGEEAGVISHISILKDLARLLAKSDLPKEDLVCCIGLFVNSLCVLQTEQLSPMFFKQIQHYTRILVNCQWDDSDPAFKDLLLWTVFNVASTMIPSTNVSKGDSPLEDLRRELFVKITKMLCMTSWQQVELRLRNFICSDACAIVFENVWKLTRQHEHG